MSADYRDDGDEFGGFVLRGLDTVIQAVVVDPGRVVVVVVVVLCLVRVDLCYSGGLFALNA